MQNFYDSRAMFAQYQQNSIKVAPTAVMMGPSSASYQQPPQPQPQHQQQQQPQRPQQQQHLQHPQQQQLPIQASAPKPEPQDPSGNVIVATEPQENVERPSVEVVRTLPSAKIDEASAEDAYVQFILYCNPSVPDSADIAELRRGYHSMPKTDGKSFDTFQLFGLIKKLESKEIETWAQLVIELGVEPPDAAKSQSSQKVQQFAVRLKRWLHAFHIDAFFQYCLGKRNFYFTHVPGLGEPMLETVRDGVLPEEDLSLRALLPELRPKRGRRKLDPNDSEMGSSAKRPLRATSLNTDDVSVNQELYSAHPQSAFPWTQPDDPWAAAHRAISPKQETITPHTMVGPRHGQHSFWVGVPDDAPATAYPQSAVTLRHSQSLHFPKDLPQSAHPFNHTPVRVRKRHGPAVSAAWTGSSSTPIGKPRGRPPTSRPAQEGPFTIFPANPSPKPTPPPPVIADVADPAAHTPVSGFSAPPSSSPFVHTGPLQPLLRKPSKLQLQVPQHAGGPVRLATPPPKLLVNGEVGYEGREGYQRHGRRTSADFFKKIDDEESEGGEESEEDAGGVDWKRRAMLLKRKLKDKEAELKAIKRKVLEAVM